MISWQTLRELLQCRRRCEAKKIPNLQSWRILFFRIDMIVKIVLFMYSPWKPMLVDHRTGNSVLAMFVPESISFSAGYPWEGVWFDQSVAVLFALVRSSKSIFLFRIFHFVFWEAGGERLGYFLELPSFDFCSQLVDFHFEFPFWVLFAG